MSNVYCVRADVRALDLPENPDPSDADVDTAIAKAAESIERYCRDFFLPTTTTIRAELGSRGIAAVDRTIYSNVPRGVADGVTHGTNVLNSASAAFTQADVGALLTGSADIPANTTIESVTSATTVVMSNAATGSHTAQLVAIGLVTAATSVVFEATNNAIAPVSYRVHTSNLIGDYDGIQFAVAGWDDTISGAEREEGGFATLFAPGRACLVTSTFARSSLPLRIVEQNAQLAAEILNGTTDVDSALQSEKQASGLRVVEAAGANVGRTTGSSRVDRALREFRRDVVRADSI